MRVLLFTFLCAGAGLAQQWEAGVGGGIAVYKNATVTSGGATADAGLKPAPAFSAFATQNGRGRLSGEIRYTFQFGDFKVSSGGTETTFSGQTHAVHYDVLFHTSSASAHVRPYVLAGGGMKIYRGTGKEQAAAPALANFAILSKTQDTKGLIVFGAGVKTKLGRRSALRLEVRDYLTPVPEHVIAAAPGAKLSGWLHGFTPMVDLSFGF